MYLRQSIQIYIISYYFSRCMYWTSVRNGHQTVDFVIIIKTTYASGMQDRTTIWSWVLAFSLMNLLHILTVAVMICCRRISSYYSFRSSCSLSLCQLKIVVVIIKVATPTHHQLLHQHPTHSHTEYIINYNPLLCTYDKDTWTYKRS